MSRHPGFPAGPGFPRTAADVNTFWSELTTRSANVNELNLAPEGLDIRNFAVPAIGTPNKGLFEMELSGTRQHYAEFTTATAIAGISATYENEAAGSNPLVLGASNVLLDWGAGVAIATDEYLVIKGTVSFGHSTLPGQEETVTDREWAVSAVLSLDASDLTPGSLIPVVDSRSQRRGYQADWPTGTGAQSITMQADTFDLTPTLVYGTSSSVTVSRIAIALGYNLGAASSSLNINRAQIHTYVIKRCR